MEVILEVLQGALVAILPVVVPLITGIAVKFLVEFIKGNRVKWDDRLAAIAVEYAEDAIEGNGKEAERLDKALEWVERRVGSDKFDADFWDGIIHATFQKNKKELNRLKNP